MLNKISQVATHCQGPDPRLRKPRFAIPAGATDTHFHILGPPNDYPYIADREYTPPDATPSAFTALRKTLGIERVVLIQPSVYGQNNSRMVSAARQLDVPARMIVVVPFNTSDSDLRLLHEAGARGVRFILAHAGGLPLNSLHRFSERVREMGWHIQFLLRPSHLIELEQTLAGLATSFVIDHVGLIRPSEGGVRQPVFQSLLRLLRTARCWVKLTGGYRISSETPPYRDVIPLVTALLNERPDRLLWGSDWPHVMLKGEMPNTTDLLDLLLEWVPDEDVRDQILTENPQELFGF